MAAKSLSQVTLKKYEDILNLEKEQTEKIIRGIDDLQKRGSKNSSGDLSSYSIHQADLGTDTDESEKRVYYLEQEIEKMKKLNQALKRVYERSYGICQICGELISKKRLEIVPYAEYCVECKSKEEKNNRRRKR
ncbi:MAG: TraR/DksA C4-type zinc finger protein [Candidatus Cloacimonetes bacterium]|nr:TraR/DksA C4-type zinc finger protein [Candidatus Cloacimonadota bacterium]